MTRWIVPAALAFAFGCAGVAAPTSDTTPGTCPRTDAPESPAPSACPACPDCPQTIQRPGHPLAYGHGFWCASRPGREGGAGLTAVVVECFRLHRTCETLREQRVKAGKTAGPCANVDSAACFIQGDLLLHSFGFRCFDSLDVCERERPSFMRERQDDGERYHFTSCEMTTHAELSERGRAIAYAVPR